MSLAPLDWAIISVFVAVSLAVGLYYRRQSGRGIEEYFVSGRRLPWWLAGTSMVATTFAADTPLAVTTLVAKYGLAGNWFWWSFAFGGMITVFIYAKLWRRSGVITDAELIEVRYGGKPARVLRVFRALYLALIVNPIIIGWVIKAMMTVLDQTVLYDRDFGMSGQLIALVAMLGVVGIYATMSGIQGVVVTDAIQFCLAMLGCIALAIVAVDHVGGLESLQGRLADQYGGDQALAFFPSFDETNAWMPLHLLVILLTVNWWATWFPGSEPGGGGFIVQRMASCKSERDSVLATLWFQVAHYAVRPWPWLLVAFVALAIQPDLRTSDDPGAAYPALIRQLAPVGLAGLMLVTFLAAFMSTISTQINWGASYLIRDVIQTQFPNASPATLARGSKLASVILLVIGGVVGWVFHRYNVNIDTAWKALAALGAGTGAVYMLRWFWWRISAWSEITAMIASLVYYVVLQFMVVPGLPDGSSLASAEVVMALVAMFTIVTWVTATYLLPKETDETLDRFYCKIRPSAALWGPVANRNPDIKSDGRFARNLLSAIFASAIVYSLLPMIGAILFGQSTTLVWSSAIAISAVFALAWSTRTKSASVD